MLAYRWIAILALPWALGPLSACSRLPTLVPDMAHSHAPVRLIGPGGPLSPARSQAIIGSLKASGVETNIFDLHLAVEQAIVGSPLTAGNRVELLQDGPATYRSMIEAIGAARDHINMESYIFDDDEVGQRFADALRGRDVVLIDQRTKAVAICR